MERYVKENFSARLKDARKELSISPETLGKIIGVSGVTIRNYERGKDCPKLSNAIALAKALNVSLRWLCGGEDEKNIYDQFDKLRLVLTDINRNPIFTDGRFYKNPIEVIADVATSKDFDEYTSPVTIIIRDAGIIEAMERYRSILLHIKKISESVPVVKHSIQLISEYFFDQFRNELAAAVENLKNENELE
jgi:DNA-binding XRE family transcriptional regulator